MWLFVLLQIRQAVTEFAILPLGSQLAHERLPHIKSLLLYGAPSTGKTMVAQVLPDGMHPRGYICLQAQLLGND
jgi:ATP-dependent 26S proteasome regulatory subunit